MQILQQLGASVSPGHISSFHPRVSYSLDPDQAAWSAEVTIATSNQWVNISPSCYDMGQTCFWQIAEWHVEQ